MAQEPPRAEPVDPVLTADAGNDFFLRGKNLYDEARRATDLDNRRNTFLRAAQILNEYILAFPNHANTEMAWWYLGSSYYQAGQVDDAKRCFTTLINRYQKGQWAAGAARTLAADYYNNTEYAFAAPMFERFATMATKPEEKPYGYYYAGNSYRMIGRDREATGCYMKVIEDPNGTSFTGQAKVALGHLLLKSGKLLEAMARFEEVVAAPLAPKVRGEAALQAALTAIKLDKTDDADRFLNLILRTPGMEDFKTDAQTALMANLFAKKSYQQVVDLFRGSPPSPDPEKRAGQLMIAARSHMRLKQPTEALTLFREVERLVKPESDVAFQASYYRLLCFFQIEGRHVPEQVDAFLQLYQKSRSADPRIHTALMMKAESLYSNKDIAGAAKVYSQINATTVSEKNRPGLLYQRGWCLAEAGDPQGAIRSLSDFISRYPDDSRVPSALAKRAKAYVDSGEPQKAIGDFDRLTADGIPKDLQSFAWLESARMRRGENNIPEMIARYQGLLNNVTDLSENLQAEANYRIGWGLVKTNAAAEAVPYLEKARQLKPEAYGKFAGTLLALGYFASQDAAKLAEEIKRAIEGDYEAEIPNQAMQWCGMQSFNSGDYTLAAKCLGSISTPDEPRATSKEVWRYLAKARLKNRDFAGAITAADNVLAVEDNSAWKADGLLDRGRALLELNRPEEALKAAEEATALHPQGRTSAGLRILTGDIDLKMGNFKEASAEYLIVVKFHDDKDLKPEALHKLIDTLDKQGDKTESDKYRQQLQTEFPDWKPQ